MLAYYHNSYLNKSTIFVFMFPVFPGILLVGTGGLITASSSGNVRLWSVKGVEQMREPGHAGRAPAGRGLVMEDEMTLDGVVTAARFDENLEMVGVLFVCKCADSCFGKHYEHDYACVHTPVSTCTCISVS